MSDQPPPALPQASSQGAAPHPAVSPAVPVRNLDYTPTTGSCRPGILTAIGVLSIVLAVPGLLYSLFLVSEGLDDRMSVAQSLRVPGPTGAAAATVGPPVTASAAPTPADAGPTTPAMQPAEREALIESMTKRRPLSSPRRRQLNAILAAVGTGLGADRIKSRSTVPASNTDEPDGDEFMTGTGYLWVYDDRAIFFSTGDQRYIRVFAPDEPSDAGGGAPAPSGGAATVPAVGPRGLSPAEIEAVVGDVDAQAKASNSEHFGLTPKQLATLRSLLAAQATGNELVFPGAAQGAVRICNNMGGNVRIEFGNSSTLVLHDKGTVMSRTGPAPVFPPFSTSLRTIGVFIATSVFSLVLAALLLVAGIMMVRRSPRARRLHLVYAWLKIPAALAAGVCFAYELYGITNDRAAGAGVRGWLPVAPISWNDALIRAALLAALGCVYPVTLLIALNTQAIRKYDHPAAAGE